MSFGGGGWGVGGGKRNPHPSPLIPRPPCGFSLIEVMIAMTILSVGVVGAIRVFPVGLRASQRSQLASRAALAAEKTIEELKLTAWESLEPGSSDTQIDEFTVTTAVDEPEIEGLVDPAALKRISVTVSWMQDRKPRSMSVATLAQRPRPGEEPDEEE